VDRQNAERDDEGRLENMFALSIAFASALALLASGAKL
jgi:hypothetical protein